MENIKNYFLIGDLHTAALVSNKGSIDWLCYPHFDSPSIFAKILDKKAGSFSVDAKGFKINSDYEKNTAILKTIFQKNKNKFMVKDFMVPQPKSKCDTHFLVRKVTCLSGECNVKFIFGPKPNYAREKTKIRKIGHFLKVGNDELMLHFPQNAIVLGKKAGYEISIILKKGETEKLVLEYLSNHDFVHPKKDLEKATKKFWEKWVAKGAYFNFCRENLIRSAITVKLMQFYPTGAIVAAPTTSLPEEIGGTRNWDYRYVWVRDATFTLYALYVLGFKEEAKKFFGFIESIGKECEECNMEVKLLYTIEGKQPPKEKTLKHLSGYKNSKPVRIGNEAALQFQLDVYGSLIDAYYFMHKRGLKISKGGKELIVSLVEKIASHWKDKDNGIWEVRHERQHFTYSKVMAWAGVNRALRLYKALGIKKEKINQWKKLEQDIKKWIWKNCYDEKIYSFTQYPGTKFQDATNFLFVLLQFLDKNDQLTKTVIKNTSKELSYKDIFVYRYLNKDGLGGKEGAFLLCSFWLISALAIIENVKAAERLFHKIENKIAANGLISEEIDPKSFEYLGNYPQAFSHIGYIMSAFYINKYKQSFEASGSLSKINQTNKHKRGFHR